MFLEKIIDGSITNDVASRFAKVTDPAFQRFSDTVFRNRLRIEREVYSREVT